MARIFVSGDKHSDYEKLEYFINDNGITNDDVIIICGDHGTLYYGRNKDRRVKKHVNSLGPTFIMIRGNHEYRPAHDGHLLKHEDIKSEKYSGRFWVDEQFPNILYTEEFGWYKFGSKDCFVIGGAYSVDKWYRLEMYDSGLHQYKWFYDEQLDEAERREAEHQYYNWLPKSNKFPPEHYIMSHTCPIKYKPYDKLLPGINQDTVDDTMEKWLDTIEDKKMYTKWFCGHWHINRRIDKMNFLYEDVVMLDEV